MARWHVELENDRSHAWWKTNIDVKVAVHEVRTLTRSVDELYAELDRLLGSDRPPIVTLVLLGE